MRRVEEQANGCWLWTGGKDPDGYGIFQWEGKSRRAHRWAYQRVREVTLDPRTVLDHYVCDNPSCVNPDHVRPASNRENLLRGNTVNAANASKSECLKGHPFDAANTYVSKAGKRMCRICIRERMRASRARRRTA